MWLLPTLSLVFDLAGSSIALLGKWTTIARPFVLAGGAICGLSGLLVLLISSAESVYSFDDTHDALFLASNLCAFLALVARVGMLIPRRYELAFVTIVFVLQATSGGLKIASSFVSDPVPPLRIA
jgi:hypothetical protein